jgi:drug/metabolite transporter (DMT)-like permease
MAFLTSRATSRASGLALVLAAACGFGLIPLFSRIGFADGLTPETAVIVRFGLPALLLSGYLPQALRSGHGGRTLVMAGAFMGIGSWGYFQAIERLPVALAALIFFTYPFFVTAYRAILLREKITARELTASALVATAVIVIFGPDNLLGGTLGVDPLSVAIGFLGPAAFAALILAVTKAPAHMSPLAVSACLFFGTILTAVPLTLVVGGSVTLPQTMQGWLALAGLMTFVGLLPQIAFASGAPAAGPTLSAIAGTMELIVALSIGWTVFGETLTLSHAAGAALLLTAIVIAARE